MTFKRASEHLVGIYLSEDLFSLLLNGRGKKGTLQPSSADSR